MKRYLPIILIALAVLVVSAGINAYLFLFDFENQEDAVVLSVLNYGDPGSSEAEVFDSLVEEFQVNNPGIIINYRTMFDQQYHQSARAAILANNAPDIMYIWPGPLSDYAINGGILPDQKQFINPDDYLVSAMADQGPNGILYEVPLSFGVTSVFYVNKSLLQSLGLSVPATYEELVAMVPTAEEAGVDVISLAGKVDWVMNSCLIGMLTGRFTGSDFFKNMVTNPDLADNEGFHSALEILLQMKVDGVLSEDVLRTDYTYSLEKFQSGKSLFMIDGHWRSGSFTDLEFVKGMEMVPFPKVNGEKFSGTSSGVVTPGYAITTHALENEKLKESSVQFLNHISGKRGSAVRLEKLGFIPVYKSQIDYSTISNPVTRSLIQRKSQMYESLSGVTDVPDAYLPNLTNERFNHDLQSLLLGEVTPDQVIKNLMESLKLEI